jgi:gas vesicle protein
MRNTRRVGYICAGLGFGSALGVLFAPKPGVETRDDLRDIAERGKETVLSHARQVQAVYERRNDLLHAGKTHLNQSVEAGRNAYRDATTTGVSSPPSSLAAIGILAVEAAALAAGYLLAVGLQKNLQTLRPSLENLVDASRTAVVDGSRQITSVSSKIHGILDMVEHVVQALERRSTES